MRCKQLALKKFVHTLFLGLSLGDHTVNSTPATQLLEVRLLVYNTI